MVLSVVLHKRGERMGWDGMGGSSKMEGKVCREQKRCFVEE